ncbi:MAG: hypothetical protein JZU65_23730 [Chlorobium sp.]|nr:hypothetical protein [Chlorobium sp.]
MRSLLQIVGGIWAVIGLFNLFESPAFKPNTSPEMGGFLLVFNIMLFIMPGLVIAGIGSMIKKKQLEKKCPSCAEMVKQDANICRYCQAELR